MVSCLVCALSQKQRLEGSYCVIVVLVCRRGNNITHGSESGAGPKRVDLEICVVEIFFASFFGMIDD